MKKINFKKIAKKVIDLEINSLKKLKLSINKSFDKAVEVILNCKNGKVIVSGVGKSGCPAEKSIMSTPSDLSRMASAITDIVGEGLI